MLVAQLASFRSKDPEHVIPHKHDNILLPNDLKRFGLSITRDSDRECKEFLEKLSLKFFY
jgi:hypothetical protein